MTKIELASRMKKTETAVRSWETGKSTPPIKVLKQLAEVFGVSLGDLVESDLTGSGLAIARVASPGLDRLKREKELLHRELELKIEEIQMLHESIRRQPAALAELQALDPKLHQQLEKWAAGEE